MKKKPYKSRLREKYQLEVVPKLRKEFNINNNMLLPRLIKVVVNTGIGEAAKKKELLQATMDGLAMITGQKPSVKKARISVAGFGLRKGMPVGLKITLRDDRMYDFLDKLFLIVLPRLRDFRGLSVDSFDDWGNYSIGLEEHTVFPEIDLTKLVKPFGLEISIVTKSQNKNQSQRLLELLGMPFEKKNSN